MVRDERQIEEPPGRAQDERRQAGRPQDAPLAADRDPQARGRERRAQEQLDRRPGRGSPRPRGPARHRSRRRPARRRGRRRAGDDHPVGERTVRPACPGHRSRSRPAARTSPATVARVAIGELPRRPRPGRIEVATRFSHQATAPRAGEPDDDAGPEPGSAVGPAADEEVGDVLVAVGVRALRQQQRRVVRGVRVPPQRDREQPGPGREHQHERQRAPPRLSSRGTPVGSGPEGSAGVATADPSSHEPGRGSSG